MAAPAMTSPFGARPTVACCMKCNTSNCTQLIMTAKAGCHSDSLERESGGRKKGMGRLARCTNVSLAPPSDTGRREYRLILKGDLKETFSCVTLSDPPLVCFSLFCCSHVFFSVVSVLLPSLLSCPSNVSALPFHDCLVFCFVFCQIFTLLLSLFLPVTTSAGVSCGVSCTVATNQMLLSSNVVFGTGNH